MVSSIRQSFIYSIGMSLLVIFTLLCLWPIEGKSEPLIPHIDKFIHFFAYAFFTNWFAADKSKLYVTCVSLFFWGVGVEILQGLGGVRSYSHADMLANLMGIFAAVVLYRQGQLMPVSVYLWRFISKKT